MASLAGSSTGLLRPPTMLEQLLEEINFQRTKEMRQLLKDGSYQFLFIKFDLFSLSHQTYQPFNLLIFTNHTSVKNFHFPKCGSSFILWYRSLFYWSTYPLLWVRLSYAFVNSLQALFHLIIYRIRSFASPTLEWIIYLYNSDAYKHLYSS